MAITSALYVKRYY